jgi:hypothetical protein
MLLKYQTGIATLVQFITLSFLGIANALNDTVVECRRDNGDCLGGLLLSTMFFILTALWFGFIWVLGYAAQERRSRRLAQLLIAAEVGVAMIAYFNATHYTNALGLATSVTDLVLAIWIIFLAFRLIRAGENRVVRRRLKAQR